jgi:hypothetical protein
MSNESKKSVPEIPGSGSKPKVIRLESVGRHYRELYMIPAPTSSPNNSSPKAPAEQSKVADEIYKTYGVS